MNLYFIEKENSMTIPQAPKKILLCFLLNVDRGVKNKTRSDLKQ